jgi:hypothetical protein
MWQVSGQSSGELSDKPGVVVHVYNPSYWVGRDRRIGSLRPA